MAGGGEIKLTAMRGRSNALSLGTFLVGVFLLLLQPFCLTRRAIAGASALAHFRWRFWQVLGGLPFAAAGFYSRIEDSHLVASTTRLSLAAGTVSPTSLKAAATCSGPCRVVGSTAACLTEYANGNFPLVHTAASAPMDTNRAFGLET